MSPALMFIKCIKNWSRGSVFRAIELHLYIDRVELLRRKTVPLQHARTFEVRVTGPSGEILNTEVWCRSRGWCDNELYVLQSRGGNISVQVETNT